MTANSVRKACYTFDHFDRMFLFRFSKTDCFRVAQLVWQRLHLCDERIAGGIRAGNEIFRIRMHNNVAA